MTTQPSYFSTKLFGLLVVLSFVASPLLTFAQTSWSPPSGPPPNNNAPAPIHKGSTGQAKYFSNSAMPPFSIGALGLIAEGVFSDFVRADELGVAAKQFCLMTSPGGESEDYFPGSGSNTFEQGVEEGFLDCIDASTGWGSGGGNTQSGLPTATAGQTLFYNSATGEWEASEFLRSLDGAMNKISIGYQSPSGGVPVDLGIHGTLKFTKPGIVGSDFYQGKILANTPGTSGVIDWVDPSTLGMGGSGALPNGVHTLPKMDILTWNSATSQWVPVATGQGQNKGYHTTYGFFATKGFAFAGSTAETGCKNYDTVSIQTVGTGADTYHRILCNDFIRVTYNPSGNTTNGANEIRFKTNNAVFTKLTHESETPRPVCAEQDGDVTFCTEFSGDGEFWTNPGTYNWQVPLGVEEVQVEIQAGGGGGGAGGRGRSLSFVSSIQAFWDAIYGSGAGGGGGGKGQLRIEEISVIPGQNLTIKVGQGGRGGCPWSANIGWFNNYCSDGLSGIPYNGKGENGENSSVCKGNANACNAGTAVTIASIGGSGGFKGSDFPSIVNFPESSNVETYIPVGGVGGLNGGSTSLSGSSGISGQMWVANLSPYNQNGNVDSCGSGASNIAYSSIKKGGNGGSGAGNLSGDGGDGGQGTPIGLPSIFNCPPATYGYDGQGKNGINAQYSSGHGGGGGGGGNSQAYQPPYQDNQPKGGIGGAGAGGYVKITF